VKPSDFDSYFARRIPFKNADKTKWQSESVQFAVPVVDFDLRDIHLVSKVAIWNISVKVSTS
jgi:hypothetical protein